MSVFKDDQTTYTGNVTILGSLNVGTNLVVTGTMTVGGVTVVGAAPITNSLSGNVALSNIANYFPGPSIAQGTVGTWFASGSVVLNDTAGAANFFVKLWDGVTIIASGQVFSSAVNARVCVALSGYIASPAGNITISCNDASSVSGFIEFNRSGNSKDATLSAIRVA